jgi:hypothetical protein
MNRLIFTLLILLQIGCEHSRALGNGESAWVSRGAYGYDDVFYCEAKKDPNGGVPKPLCYEAGLVNRGDKIGVLKK